MNSEKLTQWLMAIVLFFAILYNVSQGNFTFALILALSLPVMIMAHSPEKWWVAAVILFNSGLRVPGVAQISAFLLIATGFSGLVLLTSIMRRNKDVRPSIPQRFAFMLIMLLVFLAFYRGWGLQRLGSATWGGLGYIRLFVALAFLYFTHKIVLTEKQLRFAIKGFFLLTAVPLGFTFLSYIIPQVAILSPLIGFSAGAESETADMFAERISRWEFLFYPSLAISYLAILIFDLKKKLTVTVLFFVGLSLLCAGLTGYRSAFVGVAFAYLVYGLARWRDIPLAPKLQAVVAALLCVGMLYAMAPRLPVTYQRVLSVLPGVQVSAVASYDAQRTTDWRVDMWRELLNMVPQYLTIGRGIAFDLREAYAAYTLAGDVQWHAFFIATHTYHSGPLWALIDLGGPGFILLYGFFIIGSVYYFKRMKEMPRGLIGAGYVAFYAAFVSVILSFTIIHGSLGYIIRIAFYAAILEVFINSVEEWRKREIDHWQAKIDTRQQGRR